MITKIYAVYDSKAEAYLQPMFMANRGVAIRAFTAAVNDQNHEFCKFAADYTLFELGEFDDSNAVFKCHMTPASLGTALEFRSASSST